MAKTKQKNIYVAGADGMKIRVHCAFDKLVDIENMKPNRANPNVHGVDQIGRLALNIAAHGWRQNINVSRRSGLIVSGHARLLAAQKLELAQVPVNYQSFKSKAEELAVLVSDNVIAELADIDGPAMADILLHLDEVNYDLALTALDKAEIVVRVPTDVAEGEKLQTLHYSKLINMDVKNEMFCLA